MKEKLTMLEKMDLVRSVVELATFEDGTFNSTYLELGKVFYVTLSYMEEFIDVCPKTKDENGKENLDVFGSYDLIMEDEDSWNTLLSKKDVKKVIEMIDTRYEEVKLELLNKSNFENKLLETIEEVKGKLMETMDNMNVEKLEGLMSSLPETLKGLTPEQMNLASNLVNFKK